MRGSEARRQATQSPSKAKLRAHRAAGRRARAPAQSLPPRCYTSPEFYALEVERIFHREWLCVGRVEQVSAPGDYFSIDLLGEPLVVVRDQEGRIRALSRVCRHRAMLVVSGAGNARSFICPYHAWTYGLDGRLAGAPEMARTPGFDPSSCRLPEIPIELWEGFIFVNLGGGAQPLALRLEGLARLLRNWSVAGMEGGRSLDYDCDWNWKILADNFIECYHHIGIHRESLEPVMPARLTWIEDTDGPYSVVHMPFREGADVTAFTRTDGDVPRLPAIEGLSAEERRRGSLIHVFPCLLMSVYPERMEYYLVIPRGPERVWIRKSFCVPPSARAHSGFERALRVVADEYIKFHPEDESVCRSMQRGMSSRYAEAGPFCHMEAPLARFARYVRERVGRSAGLA